MHRIINWDETDHPLSTQNDKGGSRAIQWGDSSLPKGTNVGCRGSHHTTGIYGANTAGEPMPPVYCFDTSASVEDNFQLKHSWVDVLPKVCGRYGCPTVEKWD